jgi:hypothetical protein
MQSKPAEGDEQASVTERTERESNYEDALPWSYPLIRSPLRGQDKLSELSQVDGDLTEEQMKMINDLKVEQLKADAYLDKLIRELGVMIHMDAMNGLRDMQGAELIRKWHNGELSVAEKLWKYFHDNHDAVSDWIRRTGGNYESWCAKTRTA